MILYFPETDPAEWIEIWSEEHQPDEKNEWAYTFRVLERKQED